MGSSLSQRWIAGLYQRLMFHCRPVARSNHLPVKPRSKSPSELLVSLTRLSNESKAMWLASVVVSVVAL
jgi:hypothetical protein